LQDMDRAAFDNPEQNAGRAAFDNPGQNAGRPEPSYPDANSPSLPSNEMAGVRPGMECIPSEPEVVHNGSMSSLEQGSVPKSQESESEAKQHGNVPDGRTKTPNGDEAISDADGSLIDGHEVISDRPNHEEMMPDALQRKGKNTEPAGIASDVYSGGILQEISLNKTDWRDENKAAPGGEVD
ncbi:MAG: hypothetical protein LUI87_13695, partial [Lachnospiraceae bacterium]|nr:hypothetical protein [Lachnospiraceae bacterium]